MFDEVSNTISNLETRIAILEAYLKKETLKNKTAQKYMSTEEAYDFIKGKNNVKRSSKSCYMSHLVKTKQIHKIISGRTSSFEVAELERFMESRKVTGTIV